MKKRLYKSVEPQYSYIDKRDGKTFGSIIYGENTSISFMDKLQGKKNKNDRYERIVFTVNFLDLGSSLVFKVETIDHYMGGKYAEYAYSLLEEDSLEEYYKTALLIAKIQLKNEIDTFTDTYIKYLENEWSYPVNDLNVDMYLYMINKKIKILETIDVEESDLKYISSFNAGI